MEELKFESFDDAMNHLANLTGNKVMIAAKSKVENPRIKPRNKAEERNWDKSDMWGDPKNHKYPLFDNKSGELSAKRAKAALRYLNQKKSKASYPNVKSRAKVLAKIVRAILKADPSAEVDYQSRDKTYQALPVSVKRKMKGYKMASMSEEVEMAMRIAAEEQNDQSTIINDLKKIREKAQSKASIMKKKFTSLGLSANDLAQMNPKKMIEFISNVLSGEEELSEKVQEEEVAMASRCASDAAEIKDDLIQLIKKSGSPKYDKTVKSVSGKNSAKLNKMTVAELVDMLRDSIGKADEDIVDQEKMDKIDSGSDE